MPGLPNRPPTEPEQPRPAMATGVPTRLLGAPVTLPPGGGPVVAAGGGGTGSSARIATVVDLLRSSTHRLDTRDYFSLLVSLSRGVDYAITNNEIPEVAKDLPGLVVQAKQVFQLKNDPCMLAAILMLINSIKNACGHGWFHDLDMGEFNVLANEVSNLYVNEVSFTVEATVALDVVSQIMRRFYPQLNLGEIIVSIDAKPGYGILLADVPISKSSPRSSNERIRLLVAQKDNVETSSCIINPSEVNFLVNGKGVEKRSHGTMDTGPQLPSDVTSMLIFGTNLVQVVGQFNGHYTIVLAYMSSRSSSDLQAGKQQLQEYTQPKAMAESTSDAEIIEGHSRISLNCPISFKRIKTPVKGRLCRHHQCFDYDNYIEINLRRPSWRCPHCNQSVSFCDIRIDQNMVEVLSKVGEDAEDVFISADGSWQVSSSENADNETQLKKSSVTDQRGLEADLQSQNGEASEGSANGGIVDLTMEELDDFAANSSVRSNNCVTEDRKPSRSSLSAGNILERPVFSTSDTAVQGAAHVLNQYEDIWSRLQYITDSASNVGGNLGGAIMSEAISGDGRMREPFGFPQSSNNTLGVNPAPVLTDAVSPAFSRAVSPSSTAPAMQNAEMRQIVSTSDNLELEQQLQNRYGNPIVGSSETVSRPAIPRHVTRTPIAVQALPAQPHIPSSSGIHHRSSRTTSHEMISSSRVLAPTIPSHISAASVSPPSSSAYNGTGSIGIERLQTYLRPGTNPLLASDIAPSQVVALPAINPSISSMRTIPVDLLQQQRSIGFGHSGRVSHYQNQSVSSNLPRQSSRPPVDLLQQQRSAGFGHSGSVSHFQNQSVPSNLLQQSSRPPAGPSYNNSMGGQRQYGQMMGSLASQIRASSQLGMVAPGARTPQRTSATSVGEQHHLRHVSGVAHATAAEAQIANSLSSELPLEQNWRPTGLMRGSIVGRAHSNALGQLMLQPSSAAAPPTQARPQAQVQLPQQIGFVGGIDGDSSHGLLKN